MALHRAAAGRGGRPAAGGRSKVAEAEAEEERQSRRKQRMEDGWRRTGES